MRHIVRILNDSNIKNSHNILVFINKNIWQRQQQQQQQQSIKILYRTDTIHIIETEWVKQGEEYTKKG